MLSRETLGNWIESARIQRIILILILINALVLGLETSASLMARFGWILTRLDQVILAVFVLEISIKLYAQGPHFFRRAWNLFDFLVIAIALVPASGPLAVLRALRVLRVLRLLSVAPRLRFIVEALLAALPGIASIAALLLVLFYVSAVIATGLFGARFPEWFGSLGASMYTLFQVMTLESWSMGIARPVMEAYPYAWLFFLPFILLATYTMLNLFIAIIVNTMQTMHEAQQAAERERLEATMHQDAQQVELELRALREEIASLRRALGGGRESG
ncbi:MAG: ion transporter [Sphingobacteriia bacterium]|nr:ion transporter [Sphingobacteriia bacterium]NCC40846.1 ion transporter [Gammaproteobacteria bacterium]